MEKDPRQHGLRFLDGSSLESDGVHTPHLGESSLHCLAGAVHVPEPDAARRRDDHPVLHQRG